MVTYEPMRCECGRMIGPETREVKKTRRPSSWASCLFKCECGLAFSNSVDRKKRRRIARAPENNVPLEVACGLKLVLDKSLNALNRDSKRSSFCSEHSEDAVTWTVFHYLSSVHGALAAAVGLSVTPEPSPALLLWGVAVDETPSAHEVLERLKG